MNPLFPTHQPINQNKSDMSLGEFAKLVTNDQAKNYVDAIRSGRMTVQQVREQLTNSRHN